MEQNERKLNRLTNFDYSRNGLYFITICTKDRIRYLSDIRDVGNAALGVPIVRLTDYGKIVNDQINEINSVYAKLKIMKYVIMPDHLHMIIYLFDENNVMVGTSRTPSPTNAVIPSLISVFKRFVNKKTGCDIWQRSYHDHIIRNEREFLEICNYIDNNPINWVNDIYNQNFWR